MLQVNRLKITIRTAEQDFGFDETFTKGLNFIASKMNTCGKSSVISGIYYALGFEEIIGGKGEKVLTSVYKKSIEFNGKPFTTLESEVYLEISNGINSITLYRTAKMEHRDSRLVTVYFGTISSLEQGSVQYEDMYVHMPHSATRVKGFHTFLERFLGLELPYVNNYNDSDSKLYLQLIFSSMFVEQKRGWADVFSGMPNLGIKEAKQRTIEYILNLDTMENEKRRIDLIEKRQQIERAWSDAIQALGFQSRDVQCTVQGIPRLPQILDETVLAKISICINGLGIDVHLSNSKDELALLSQLKHRVIDNFDEIQIELEETEKQIDLISAASYEARMRFNLEDASIKTLKVNLETIKIDIANNKDAARLRQLGSDIGSEIMSGTCPVCNRAILDTLLPQTGDFHIMSIDENINHLVAQKEMYEFALKGRSVAKEGLKNHIANCESKVSRLRRLALSLRSDLYAVDDQHSESILCKRLELASHIHQVEGFRDIVDAALRRLGELSDRWKEYLEEAGKLPKEKLTLQDQAKLRTFESNFREYLRQYGYKSISNLDDISISRGTYLPVIDNFDMKFDSSASDNIRAIWAFTLALLQTSSAHSGNHPNMLIFDEPDQHSIIIANMDAFFRSVINTKTGIQVILGITVKDTDTRTAINHLGEGSYKMIEILDKAFVPLGRSAIKGGKCED